MSKLKITTDDDVGIVLTSRAWMRIHVWGVAAVQGAPSSMTLVISSRTFVLLARCVVQSQNRKAPP
jgi:hypothetical protein